jgi:hypothetical protein
VWYFSLIYFCIQKAVLRQLPVVPTHQPHPEPGEITVLLRGGRQRLRS